MKQSLMLMLLVSAACMDPSTPPAGEASDPLPISTEEQARVEDAIGTIDQMRSSLAQTIGAQENVDQATFGRVCKPVGQRAKQIAEANGWQIQQLTVKYRNPNNAADPEAVQALTRFAAASALVDVWQATERDGQPGARYFRRIVVEPSCLACHGAEEARPAFVEDAYPEDRAFGFEAGDLRGVYSVFVPAHNTPASGSD